MKERFDLRQAFFELKDKISEIKQGWRAQGLSGDAFTKRENRLDAMAEAGVRAITDSLSLESFETDEQEAA